MGMGGGDEWGGEKEQGAASPLGNYIIMGSS